VHASVVVLSVLTSSSAARIALYLAKITDNVSTLADHLISHNLGNKFLEKVMEILMLLSTF
jgi:hypothetical protein